MVLEGVAGPVVATGGAGVGVAGGVLDVLEGDPGLAGQGDEGVAQRVGVSPGGRPAASARVMMMRRAR